MKFLSISFLCSAIAFGNVAFAQERSITIDLTKKAQRIDNIGASGCWYAEPVGKFWSDAKRDRMAELLFSKELDAAGNPKGIGLSAWRFNIGAGSTEQGDSSGIRKDEYRRAESFLKADGSYDWTKQQGAIWFTKKAQAYDVEKLIAFTNSPPVFYTKNGLAYKTVKNEFTNLKEEKFTSFATFLAEVLTHFEKEKIHFDYISPVNEPQWEWYNKYGEGTQEGSPYTNGEIYKVVKTLDKALTDYQLKTQILLPESGALNYLYDGGGRKDRPASHQIQHFWDKDSALYLGNLSHVPRIMAAHSYFTDAGGDSNIVNIRQKVTATARQYQVEYWQSEYSMLDNGFREGTKGKRSEFDCAMFLSKIIHHDLTNGNATAWQLWTAMSPDEKDFDVRYSVLTLEPKDKFHDGDYIVTKNLWALGHFSRFVRPGMERLVLAGYDERDKDLLVSGYTDDKNRLVLVIINYSSNEQKLNFKGEKKLLSRGYSLYTTDASGENNMKATTGTSLKKGLHFAPRSMTTVVVDR